jgi:hypothetical protein
VVPLTEELSARPSESVASPRMLSGDGVSTGTALFPLTWKIRV